MPPFCRYDTSISRHVYLRDGAKVPTNLLPWYMEYDNIFDDYVLLTPGARSLGQ